MLRKIAVNGIFPTGLILTISSEYTLTISNLALGISRVISRDALDWSVITSTPAPCILCVNDESTYVIRNAEVQPVLSIRYNYHSPPSLTLPSLRVPHHWHASLHVHPRKHHILSHINSRCENRVWRRFLRPLWDVQEWKLLFRVSPCPQNTEFSHVWLPPSPSPHSHPPREISEHSNLTDQLLL